MTAPNEYGVITEPMHALELPRTDPPTWKGGPWAAIKMHPSDCGQWFWARSYDLKLQGASSAININAGNLAPTIEGAMTAAKTRLSADLAKIKGPDRAIVKKIMAWLSTLETPRPEIQGIVPNKTPTKGTPKMAQSKERKQFIKVTVTGFIPAPENIMDIAAFERMHNQVKQIKTLVHDNLHDVKFDAKSVGRMVDVEPDTPPEKTEPVRDPSKSDPLTVATDDINQAASDTGAVATNAGEEE